MIVTSESFNQFLKNGGIMLSISQKKLIGLGRNMATVTFSTG